MSEHVTTEFISSHLQELALDAVELKENNKHSWFLVSFKNAFDVFKAHKKLHGLQSIPSRNLEFAQPLSCQIFQESLRIYHINEEEINKLPHVPTPCFEVIDELSKVESSIEKLLKKSIEHVTEEDTVVLGLYVF